ncbi:MAG: hypothetical protein N2508_04510, partial [Anaerolineae bacterium]|nr:hypothetical protein [Anaerolineae bacterium]
AGQEQGYEHAGQGHAGQGQAGQGQAGQGQALPLRWRWRVLHAAGAALAAALTLWAIYGFEVRRLPGMPLPLPAATHVAIYRSLQEHYTLGHPAFLLGQNRDRGWWYYFPVAFVLKTPLPTLILLIASLGGYTRIQGYRDTLRCWGPLVLFPIFYTISSFFSSVNIGYRHLLPLLPFVFVISSRITGHGTRNTWRVARIACCVICLAWLVLGTLRISPHYLAYFNVPDGYRYLVDSNLDWGQNLWQLREWMEHSGVERVYYAHFSPARPEVYGIQVDMLPPSPRAVPFAPLDPAPGVYAIGATVLQGVYTPDVNTYAWFRAREPVARLGHALFIYRIEPRPALRWAAVCATPAPTLSPETVQAGLGRPDLRVVLFDCTQAWIYPGGEGPGLFVLPPDIAPPPGARLEARARHADGTPFYNTHRVEAVLVAEHPVDIAFNGPLDFLGYRLDGHRYRPGDTIELWTFWRIREAPARLLSLMAHLVDAGGIPVAVGDGLGVPIEQWRAGDIMVQCSRFPIAEGMAGAYHLHVGVYWLDTMERWSVRLPDGTAGDHIALAPVEIEW